MAIAFGGKVDFFREISTRSFASPPLINKLSKVENTESGGLTKDSHAVLRSATRCFACTHCTEERSFKVI